jgi:hypothetical protein
MHNTHYFICIFLFLGRLCIRLNFFKENAMKSSRLVLTFLLTVFGSTTLLAQHRTIVGDWGTSRRDCRAPDGVIAIEPLAMRSSDFYCSFKNVSRNGSTVTWNGTCEDHIGNVRPYSETVIADEDRGVLTIKFARNRLKADIAPLVRCN